MDCFVRVFAAVTARLETANYNQVNDRLSLLCKVEKALKPFHPVSQLSMQHSLVDILL